MRECERNEIFAIPEFMSQLPLVPDPHLLGPGTKYHHIQQVTENQGFYQIKKFVYQNTPEKKHVH